MITILAIDDNPDNLTSLKAIIHDSFPASAILTAQTGLKGIELAIDNNPDVILLDVIMPVMDGFEVCRRLKSDERVSNIPVVFLTALGGEKQSRIRALEVGADSFLSKPIDETELTAQIRAMVKIKAAQVQKLDEKIRLEKLVAERTAALETELNERKRIEESLRESETRFRHISLSISDISYSCVIDSKGNSSINWLFGAIEKITGYSSDELFAMECWGKIVTREDFPVFKRHVLEVKPGNSDSCQLRLKRKDGAVVWIQASTERAIATNSTLGVLYGGLVDITERKMAEAAILASQSQFRSIFEKAADAIFIAEIESGIIVDANEAASRLMQMPHDQLVGLHQSRLHPAGSVIQITDSFTMHWQAANQNILVPPEELTIIRSDGAIIPIEILAAKVTFDGKDFLMGTFRNITERKNAEKALKESEYFFKESQHAAFVGSYNFNLISDHWTSSEVLDEIFGIDCSYDKTMLGWLGIVHPEDRMTMETYFHEEIVVKRSTFNREYRIIRKSDDVVRWVLGLGKLTYDDQGNIVTMIGTIQDITERKQAEIALYQSNQLNKSLLQTIPFGMDIVDEEGNILFISDNLKKHLKAGFHDKKCWEFYRDDQTQCSTCPLVKGIKVGESDLYETFGVFGGKTFQISHTGMMYQGKKAMLEIFQDITEKKEIEKKVRLLAHSLESISECVSITDSEDIIIYVNRSFLNTYGYVEREIIGQRTAMLRPNEIANLHVRETFHETAEGGWRGEIMNRKKDGTLFPILLSTSIIKDDNDAPIALIGVAIDISEMKQSREELIQAKEQAEEGNRLKAAFLNNMSHEIRTPMNHIMGFASLMTEAEGSEKDAYAEIILNSSNQLLSLIEDVILLSRLQSEKTAINVHEFSPELLITNTISTFNSGNMESAVPLNFRIPNEQPYLTIYSDNEKIKHILANLVSNSIKYTFEGAIELGYELHPEEITFYVKDTGIGIPLMEQQKIYESFYRGDQAVSLAIGGTGLGLSIVKELVRALNGRLNLESEPAKGSCFSFTIPFIQSPDGKYSESDSAKPHKPMKDLVLLVADDEEVNFLYLEILMKNSIRRMDHAINGKEAVEMVRKDKYDIILMDLKMPEMDGFDATSIIKQEFPHIPVIAQTAYTSAEDREKAKLAGVDDFISKPINKDAIIDLILKYS